MKYHLKPGERGEFNCKNVYTPKEGGVYSEIETFPVPFKGFPYDKYVDIIASMKWTVPAMITFIKEGMKRPSIAKIRSLKKISGMALKVFYERLKPLKPLSKRYSPAVKEIHRVTSLLIDRENSPNLKKEWMMVRDLMCMVLEFDNAYRYRFQDFMSELDVSKIKLDEKIDLYHCGLRDEYNYGGRDYVHRCPECGESLIAPTQEKHEGLWYCAASPNCNFNTNDLNKIKVKVEDSKV